MKLKLLTLLFLLSSLNAVELRFGKGTFEWDMGIKGFMNSSFDLDINTLSLSESHANITGSDFYLFFNADLYRSSFVDRMTNLMSTPITHDFPIFGSVNDAIDKYTPIPVPSSYKVRGFDINLGLGYDFYKDSKGYLGIGVDTGLSMPVMDMKNLKKTAEFTLKVLDTTKTKLKTYKIGPTLQGRYDIAPNITTYGSFGFGMQTGSIENEWFRSSVDIDGSYNFVDFGVNFIPLTQYKNFQLSLGYTKKNWSMDNVKIDMFNIFEVTTLRNLTNDFSTSSLYLGFGYNF